MKKRLAIIGSGVLGMHIAHQAVIGDNFSIAGFYDDTEPRGKIKNGYTILGNSEDVERAYMNGDFDCLTIGIGFKHMARRKELFDKLKGKVPFANIIHPKSYIDPTVRLGEGIVIHPGCVIDMHTVVGDNVILNANVFLAHDTTIEAHSFFSAEVKIAGSTRIGECANLGIGTIVIDNLEICANVHTGAGTLVVKNIDKPGLYIGSPAKFHRA